MRSILIENKIVLTNNFIVSTDNRETYLSIGCINDKEYALGQINTDGSISRLIMERNKLYFQYFSSPSTYSGSVLIAQVK